MKPKLLGLSKAAAIGTWAADCLPVAVASLSFRYRALPRNQAAHTF